MIKCLTTHRSYAESVHGVLTYRGYQKDGAIDDEVAVVQHVANTELEKGHYKRCMADIVALRKHTARPMKLAMRQREKEKKQALRPNPFFVENESIQATTSALDSVEGDEAIDASDNGEVHEVIDLSGDEEVPGGDVEDGDEEEPGWMKNMMMMILLNLRRNISPVMMVIKILLTLLTYIHIYAHTYAVIVALVMFHRMRLLMLRLKIWWKLRVCSKLVPPRMGEKEPKTESISPVRLMEVFLVFLHKQLILVRRRLLLGTKR